MQWFNGNDRNLAVYQYYIKQKKKRTAKKWLHNIKNIIKKSKIIYEKGKSLTIMHCWYFWKVPQQQTLSGLIPTKIDSDKMLTKCVESKKYTIPNWTIHAMFDGRLSIDNNNAFVCVINYSEFTTNIINDESRPRF